MSNTVEKIKYRGFTIKVKRDMVPSNPFEEWDCEPPIITLYDGYLKTYGDIEYEIPELTRDEIKSHTKDIIAELSGNVIGSMVGGMRYVEPGTLLKCLTAFEYSGRHNYSNAVEYINDTLNEYFQGLSKTDGLEFMATVYGWKGIVAVCGSSQGYSQGDYVEVLAVATPEWVKTTGAPEDSLKRQMEGTIKLYSDWAWGDVYGFVIKKLEDSCWGFYGDNHEESGLLEHAKNSIDCHIEHVRKENQKQVKAWIKNRIPYQHRIFSV